MKDRVQKILSAVGLASRREAERWISEGRVKVNGTVVTLGESADRNKDKIEVDNKLIDLAKSPFTYLMINKPVGYVTTLKDPKGRPTVVDLVDKGRKRLVPVGRLDYNSEGLLIMTDDGDFVNRLTHPKYKVSKTYLVRVHGTISTLAVSKLREGVQLDDGKTLPAVVDDVKPGDKNSWLTITITEGRNRQVRRMCDAVGFTVVRLKRIAVGNLQLGKLPRGRSRELDTAEIKALISGGVHKR